MTSPVRCIPVPVRKPESRWPGNGHTGSKRNNEATQFRIVTGHGCFVTPVKQKARVLALREAEIVEECITSQGIRLNVRAVAAFKVGDDQASIANGTR